MRAVLRITTAVACFVAPMAFAATTPLDCLGQSFYAPNIVIEWDLKTNPLPATVRIQKLVSGSMEDQVISNMLRLAGFSETHRVDRDFRGSRIPNDTLAYRSANDRSSLSIIPAQGILSFITRSFLRIFPRGFRDEARAFQLATNLLQELRLPTDQLLKQAGGQLRAWFYPGTMTQFVKREPITRPYSMGVEFRMNRKNQPAQERRALLPAVLPVRAVFNRCRLSFGHTFFAS